MRDANGALSIILRVLAVAFLILGAWWLTEFISEQSWPLLFHILNCAMLATGLFVLSGFEAHEFNSLRGGSRRVKIIAFTMLVCFFLNTLLAQVVS